MISLSIFTLFFWFFHILRRIFYSLYCWQLKEYRLDRFLEEISRNKKIVFPGISFLALFLLLFSFLTYQIELSEVYWNISIFFLYLFFGGRSLYLVFKKGWRFPKFTLKMLLLLLFVLLVLLFYLLLFSSLKFILVLEILLPIFISFSLLIIQIPTIFAKRYIMLKAKKKREGLKNLIVIGITGSFGKSSTKEFLATFLSKKYNVLKTEGNTNTEIGVANTVLQKLNKEHQIFICEMAAYKRGEIKNICNIAKPKIGILTGINQQHLSLFGSQENIVKAKFEMIDNLPEDGVAVLNWDNNFIKQNHRRNIKTVKYSVLDKDDIWAENIKSEKDSISFRVHTREGDSTDFRLNLIGEHNISNILGAVAVAGELGMSLNEISQVSFGINSQQSGMQLKKGINGLNIIDATYSANPDGVMAHLEYLKIWEGKKIIIIPCLIELGSAAIEVHRRIGKKIGEVCDLAIITTKDKLRELRDEAIKSGMKEENILFLENPKEIFEKIKSFCKSGDVVLLESRVPSHLIGLLVDRKEKEPS